MRALLASFLLQAAWRLSAADEHVIVASPDELLSCLALRREVLHEQLHVVTCREPVAYWQGPWSLTTEWRTLRLGGARLCAILEKQDQGKGDGSSELSLVSSLCRSSEKLVSWRWDESHRIQVRADDTDDQAPSGDGQQSAELCLDRAQGSQQVRVRGCSDASSQEWLLLPRGDQDPNGNLAEVQLPLHVDGRWIVDAAGVRVPLHGVNWYGAHMEQKVNNGLEQQRLEDVARLIKHLGFNSVRLNYAVQMWFEHQEGVLIDNQFVAANPELLNKTSLEVFDAVVDALTAEGLLVVVCCHTSDFRWCCGLHDDQSLWYNDRWTERQWLDSLTGLAQRYSSNPRVVGYDVRNEPRPNVPTGRRGKNPILIWWDTTVWGNCSELSVSGFSLPHITIGSLSHAGICLPQHTADWRRAATQAAFAVWHGNDEALVFIEGVGGADLAMVQKSPMNFKQDCLQQKVVWSVHDYKWFWKWMQLGEVLHHGGTSFPEILQTLQGIYSNSEGHRSWEDFKQDRNQAWAYLLKQNIAPVWIGEFGAGGNTSWWNSFKQYAYEMDLDWCYWSLDAYKYQPGVVIDSDYMDSMQRINTPLGKPLDRYYEDGYGLLGLNYASVRSTSKLVDLIRLQLRSPMGKTPLATARKPKPCEFDGLAQPVVGTGPHPEGFESYVHKASANATFEARCVPHQRRLKVEEGRVTPVAAPNPLGHDGADFAAWASRHREEACLNVAEPIDDEVRSRARSYLAKEAGSPNPVAAALQSGRPDTMALRLQELVDLEISTTRAYFIRMLLALAIVLLLVCFLVVSPQVQRWGRSRAYATATLLGATSPSSWRSIVIGIYAGLIVAMVAVAWHIMSAKENIDTGIANTLCAATRGIDEALNGDTDEDGFLGLLPTLSEVSTLIEVLADNSTFWRDMKRLKKVLDHFPDALDQLGELLVALETHASKAPCSAINATLVAKAKHKVDWGITRTWLLVIEEGDVLAAQGDQLVHELRKHLSGAQTAVKHVKDFLLQQSKRLRDEDPLAYAQDVASVTRVGFLAIFAFVLPILLFSLIAILRLLTVPSPYAESPPEDGNNEPRRDHHVVRPGAALFTWTTALLYATVVFGMSLWLSTMGEIAADACVVLDNLTEDRLQSYVYALGLPRRGPKLVQEASLRVVSECFAKDAETNGDIGSLIKLETCPLGATEPVVESVEDVLLSVREELSKRFEGWAKLVGEKGTLQQDPEIGRLMKTLSEDAAALQHDTELGGADDADAGCRPDPKERCKVLHGVYQELCGSGKLQGCDTAMTEDMSCTSDYDLNPIANIISGAAKTRIGIIDHDLVQASDIVLKSLWGQIENRVLPAVKRLVESLDCQFLQRTLGTVVDGSCFQVTVGIISVRNALFVLAVLCAALSLTMYVVWLRLTLFGFRAAEHLNVLLRAVSCGTPLDLSHQSRGAAQGMELPVFAPDAVRTVSLQDALAWSAPAVDARAASAGERLHDDGGGSEEELVDHHVIGAQIPETPTDRQDSATSLLSSVHG